MSAINPRVHKASQILQILVNDKIKDSTGNIIFNFLGTSVNINEKSAIGDLFQEWLAEYFRHKKIYFRTKNNTQEFPDFLLNPQSDHEDLLEIKTFDYTKAPNFDGANFESYCRSLKDSAYRLDANYLIFGYQLVNSQFSIRDIWLKKIWEITGSSEALPIKCQVRQNVIYNIRPITWYSDRVKYSPFANRQAFVKALSKTLEMYGEKYNSITWLNNVRDNYFLHTNLAL
jgi:type II restriction enzyme